MDVFVQFLVTLALSLGASVAAYVALRYFLAQKAHGDRLVRWNLIFSARWADRVFLALVSGYILVFSSLAVLRYLNFHTGYVESDLPFITTSWDLGLYHQLIWNSLHGRLLEGTYVLDASTYLGKNFTPILLGFVPLYAVWSDPIVLLIVQTVALGFGALPIYWYGRKQIGRALAIAVATIYFLSPGLENMNLHEFHEIALATPLLAYATFFLLRRHYNGFLVCLGVALLVKEEIAFVTIAFGVYIFLVQGKRWFGLGLALCGVVWGVLLLQYIIPFFRGAEFGTGFYYFDNGSTGGGASRYAYLGRNISEIIVTVITRPGFVLQQFLVPDKIEFALHLFVPLAFIPLIGVEVAALSLPTFGYSLLSLFGPQYSINTFYFAPILPFLFMATIVGLRRLLKWSARATFFPWLNRVLTVERVASEASLFVLLLVSGASSYYFQAPGPFARYFQAERYLLTSHAALGNALMRSIPHEATVVTQQDLLAHLSGRKLIYEIPLTPDYRQADYLVADTTAGWYNVHRGYWDYFLSTGYFESVTQQDGFLIAKRRAPEHPVQVRFGDQFTFLGYTILPTGTLRGGMILRPAVLWRADKRITERYRVALRVVDAQEHLWAEEDREPDEGFTPTTKWTEGTQVGDQYHLRLPPTTPTGAYQISLAVHRLADDQYLEAYDGDGNLLGPEAMVASLRIEKNKSSFTASDLVKEQPLSALFVDMQEIRFLGYVPPPQTISPGEMLHLGLYWRARAKPQGDYVVVAQLRDADGRVAFEQAARPANNAYPTTLWDAGEVLLDWHDFVVPQDIAVGDYQIFVLLREGGSSRLIGGTKISNISITH